MNDGKWAPGTGIIIFLLLIIAAKVHAFDGLFAGLTNPTPGAVALVTVVLSHRHRLVCDYGCLAYVGQNLSGCRWCMERDSRADKIPRYYAVAGCLNYLLVCLPQRPMTYYTKDVLTGFGVLAAMMLFAAAYI